QSHFVGCTSVSLSASPASPQFTQTSVTLTASAANCTNAQYRFLLMTPDGAWRTVQDYSTANMFKWTSTANAGGYRIEVDARAAASGAYDTYTAINDMLRSCTSAALIANKPSPQPPGSTMTFTATASCPSTPEYRFWAGQGGRWS